MTHDRRVAALLRRLGLSAVPASAEAADLLRDRGRVRRRANGWIVLGVVVAVVLLALGYGAAGVDGRGVLGVVAIELVISLIVVLRHETIRRGERALRRLLPRRTTRAEAVPVSTVLGRPAVYALGAIVVLHAVLVGILFARGEAGGAWGLLGVCVASYLVAAWAVAQVTGRPVLAVDPLTLAVDDRLRSADAGRACAPMLLAGVTFTIVVGPASDTFVALLGLAPLFGNLAFQFAVDPTRFNRSPAR